MTKMDKKRRAFRPVRIAGYLAAVLALLFVLTAVNGVFGIFGAAPGEPPRWFLFGEGCSANYAPGEGPSVCLARNLRTKRGGTNSRGLWGGEVSPRKSAGFERIVCLGGTLTQGEKMWGGEPGYPGRLEQLLNKGNDLRRHEVLNAGVAGSTSRDLLIRYRKDVAPLRPDAVVLMWGEEDFRACRMFTPEQTARLKSYMDSGDEKVLADLGGWFERHADYFRAVRFDRVGLVGEASALGILGSMARAEGGGGGSGLLSDAEGLRNLRHEVEKQTGRKRPVGNAPGPAERSAWADFGEEGIVEALSPVLVAAREDGAALVLVTAPSEARCDPSTPVECDAVTASGADLDAYIAGPVRRALDDLARQFGGIVVDAHASFSAEERPCKLFEGEGARLSVRGEETVARSLARVLPSPGSPPGRK